MKKLAVAVIGIAIIALAAYLVFRIHNKIQQKQITEKITATIPLFTFQTETHQNFGKQNIADTLGNIVFMLFSPTCEHCQYMAQTMVSNKQQIKNVQVIMVTPFADSAAVVQFAQTYGLNTLPNVQLLLDRKMNFPKIFGATLTPSFFIYKNNRLVKTITGETKLENLLAPFTSPEGKK